MITLLKTKAFSGAVKVSSDSFCLNNILRTAAFQKILTVSNLENKLLHIYRIHWIPYGEETLLQYTFRFIFIYTYYILHQVVGYLIVGCRML